MKSKLVYISLSPSVELCKKKHSFKKLNFKENRQFDTWNVWHGRLIIFKCQIVTFFKVEARDSEPLGLKIVRALEQASLRVRKAPLT